MKTRKLYTIIFLVLVAALVGLIMACGDEGTGHNPPVDHTANQDDVWHKPGYKIPLTGCVDCHGADLKGGTSGVSCFECHDKKW